MNFILVICGATGSGKSYCGLRIAQMVSPKFTIDHVCFTAEDFLRLVNSGKLKRGDVVLWDETGVGVPSRAWYSISNKAINFVLQTFRRENICLIMTTPALSFLDIQARILSHALIETQHIDRKRKRVLVKFKMVEANPESGKIYRKYQRRGKGRISKIWVSKPSDDIVKEYEEKKKEFAQALYESAMRDVVKLEIQTKKPTDKKIAAEIVKNPKNWMRIYQGKEMIDIRKIEVRFGVGERIARRAAFIADEALKRPRER